MHGSQVFCERGRDGCLLHSTTDVPRESIWLPRFSGTKRGRWISPSVGVTVGGTLGPGCPGSSHAGWPLAGAGIVNRWSDPGDMTDFGLFDPIPGTPPRGRPSRQPWLLPSVDGLVKRAQGRDLKGRTATSYLPCPVPTLPTIPTFPIHQRRHRPLPAHSTHTHTLMMHTHTHSCQM